MIKVYANANKKEKKQYTALSVKHATTQSGGRPYTMFTISDSKRLDDGTFQNDYYTVFVWEYLSIEDKDKITFKEIQAVEVSERTGNDGRKYFNKTIYAEVDVVGKSQPSAMPEIEPSDALPF